MVQGMSRGAWDEFFKSILVRYVLSHLWGTLYLEPSGSLKRTFSFSAEGLFSHSAHAVTCLNTSQHNALKVKYGVPKGPIVYYVTGEQGFGGGAQFLRGLILGGQF